jgi:muramoyltetrapeptide carboxypeptidase
VTAVKPPALVPGGLVRVISTASPADRDALGRGIAELERLGYHVRTGSAMQPEGYFAGSTLRRKAELEGALQDPDASAVICARGGYGTATLLDQIRLPGRLRPKLLIGYSDVTMLQACLWTRFRWTSLHGPMVAAGFNNGAGVRSGYDLASFLDAEPLSRGEASGLLLGGCISLFETTLGTPWEFDTRGAILFLEDRGVKPYQLDRMLLHMLQAGKFRGVRGIVLGDFPDSEPPQECSPSVRDICRRILMPLRVPIIFGAPIGHTVRPMLTIPFGVRARLRAAGEGQLEILEPAVRPQK